MSTVMTNHGGRLDRVLGTRVQYALARTLERVGALDEAREAYFAVLIMNGAHASASRHWRALSIAQASAARTPTAAMPLPGFVPDIRLPSPALLEGAADAIAR